MGEISDPADLASNLSSNGHTDIVTVVVVWAYSICVSIVIAIVYYLLNQIAWLDNLGRAQRSRADTQLENILGHLSKLALEHERSDTGVDHYHLIQKTSEAEEDE